MSHAQTGRNTTVHDTHKVCRLPAPARLLRRYTQGKKRDNTPVITQTGEWRMMFKGKWKEGEERKKEHEMVKQTSLTCISTMLWLMHNICWLYIQLFHISVIFRSCSLCLSAVPSKCHLFCFSPCLYVQYDMLSPADTYFFFLLLSSFLTTSFWPFITRPKRVLVHTRTEVIKKKKKLLSIQWKTKLCKQVSYKIYFMLEFKLCALLSISFFFFA